MISDVSKAANESLSLRERVGMTHRSLTMIEMRQEKVMREALYENGEAVIRNLFLLFRHKSQFKSLDIVVKWIEPAAKTVDKGSIPGRVKPKTIKIVIFSFLLFIFTADVQH